MNKNLLITCLLGLTAVILGAFATHALEDVLNTDEMNSLQTGIRYQIYHVIVLLFINSYAGFSEAMKNRLSMLFFLGILFFSGSIYLIYLAGVSAKSIWFITPLGGLFLILGWLWMAIFFAKQAIDKK